MKKILSVFALMLLATPVLADGGAGAVAGAMAGANAGSSATNNGGDALGSASVAGAYCVDSAVIGPFALSKTMRPCVAAQIAETGVRLGTLSMSEGRALQLKALEGIGYTFVKPQAAAAVTSSTKSAPAAKSDPMTYNGDWKSLSKKAQQSILACETLWNSKQIEGCTYN